MFALGILLGFMFQSQLLAYTFPITWEVIQGQPDPGIEPGMGDKMFYSLSTSWLATGGVLATAILATVIFLKNSLVALMCVMLSKRTRGILPAVICLANGIAIGLIAVLSSAMGFSLSEYLAMVVPHGVIELPAIILACTLGIMAGAQVKNLRVPVSLLAVAAAVEVWITPVLAQIIA